MDFLLVHGAYHGPWCWSLLQPELIARGHTITVVDLPVSDPEAGATQYRDAVLDAAGTLEMPVVVGHSMAGGIIPLVAEARPVRAMVFLCAFIPEPGRSLNDLRREQPIETFHPSVVEFEDLGSGVWMIGPGSARELFFHDIPDDLAGWAFAQLRPQNYGFFSEPLPFEDWPDVPSSYILCDDDHAIDASWAREATRARLGVEAIELPGGHSPFLSQPARLADALDVALG